MQDDIIKKLEDTGEYRVIRRLKPVEQYNERPEDIKDIKQAIFLDVETTGMNSHIDKIIELAMVPFKFDSTGTIYDILPAYNSFQDPGIPIPEKITDITGITNEMVAGQVIDLSTVKNMLNESVLVIAHNAAFDRPFCEYLSDAFASIAWGCSCVEIPWRDEGIESRKLEYLVYQYGFFYEGHRAEIDCYAGIKILSRPLPKSGVSALKMLLDSARRSSVRLWAENAPYESKEILKKRGYRWSAGEHGLPKAWYIDLPEDKIELELAKLNQDVYLKKQEHLPMEHFNAKKRYSHRI